MILHLLCTNTGIAVNKTQAAIKILQGSAVTETKQGGLVMCSCCKFLVSICLPKIMQLVVICESYKQRKSAPFV